MNKWLKKRIRIARPKHAFLVSTNFYIPKQHKPLTSKVKRPTRTKARHYRYTTTKTSNRKPNIKRYARPKQNQTVNDDFYSYSTQTSKTTAEPKTSTAITQKTKTNDSAKRKRQNNSYVAKRRKEKAKRKRETQAEYEQITPFLTTQKTQQIAEKSTNLIWENGTNIDLDNGEIISDESSYNPYDYEFNDVSDVTDYANVSTFTEKSLLENDRIVRDILTGDSAIYNQITQLEKELKFFPERLPGTAEEDRRDDLAYTMLIRGYRKELEAYPEKESNESNADYAKRLAKLVEESGKETLFSVTAEEQDRLTKLSIATLGYDPRAPVGENEHYTEEDLLNYIVDNWGNITVPKKWIIRGKPYKARILREMRRLDDVKRRNKMEHMKQEVKRKLELSTLTADKDIPEINPVDVIDQRLDFWITELSGTPEAEAVSNLKAMWEDKKRELGENGITQWAHDHGEDVLEALDEVFPEWYRYKVLFSNGMYIPRKDGYWYVKAANAFNTAMLSFRDAQVLA